MKRINVQKHGILPGRYRENTLQLRWLLEQQENGEETELFFPAGEYHFYPDYAWEECLCISNHDEDTLKRVVFLLKNTKNLSILGEDAVFLFHTEEMPFHIHGCENIRIEGITIDYDRPTFSEGIIEYVDSRRVVLWIDRKKYPWHIAHERLFFTGEGFCCELQFWMEVDRDTYAPVYGTGDMAFAADRPGNYGIWKELGEDRVEMTLDQENCSFSAASRKGNQVVLRHHPRSAPAFYVTESRDILLRRVNVCHALGMGFLAELCEGIELDQFCTTFRPGEKRPCTANADAAQMICCGGKIHIHHCLFENQFDDPVNIHGIYVRIHKVLGPCEVIGELVHHQHKGALIGKAGDTMRLVAKDTMLPVGTGRLEGMERLNRDFVLLRFEQELAGAEAGMALENGSRIPDEIVIEHCVMRNNRARGLLLTQSGKTVVRKNVFQVPGAAILVSGDCQDWFESGAAGEILVEENLFDCCSYIPNWGKAPIQVEPSARRTVEGEYYHQSLTIRRNTFRCFDERLIWAYNLNRLVFQENSIERTDQYPPIAGERFFLSHVGEFVEEY